MVLSQITVDMEEYADELESEVESLEEEREQILQKAEAQRQEDGEIDASVEEDFDEVESELTEKKGELSKFREVIEEWNGSEFEITELTFGQLQAVSDDMVEESFEVDVDRGNVEGTPRQGYYQIELLNKAVIGAPPGAPTRNISKKHGSTTKPDPKMYPIPVSEWLFDKVDALNTTGDAELGNSSLDEAMRKRRD